jgi:parallel beta-helix repeat protein
MTKQRSIRSNVPILLTLAAALLFGATQAHAFPQSLKAWQERYNPPSASGDNADCQLCHANSNGGEPWNGYGWDVREALADGGRCDLNGNGVVSNDEAFFCIEMDNSDNDGSGYDNAEETGLSTQPGWTNGPTNNLYFRSGAVTTGNLAPDDIGPLDPDGTEPPPEPPPQPPGEDSDAPPGQLVRNTIVVKPGQSIQAAIDRAAEGTRIYILAGTYSEVQNPTNGLNITKNGISLVGQRTEKKEVIFENAGSQRNGIVIVPPEVTDCMSCHSDMAPPFPILAGVPPGLPDPEPLLYDIEVRNITIKGFRNNGLFTERVDGFNIIGVNSVDNHNYGIFPTLSKNGLISHSTAIGSDHDSGIWVETSENVSVLYSHVEGNVNGIEVSNSDDILLAHNTSTGNTVGAAILLLPDIFDDRPGAKRIDMRDNVIIDNNKDNSARPGSVLSFIPKGIGILYAGVDDSLIEGNLIQDNDFVGVAIADYCAMLQGTDFDCQSDPNMSLEYLLDQAAENNHVIENTFINNGTAPGSPEENPFYFAASDMALLTFFQPFPNPEPFPPYHGNCYEGNDYTTFFSLFLGAPGVPFAPPTCE